MATLRKRGDKWQVQIRRDGFPNLSKSFLFREDAVRWGRENERRIDRGELVEKRTDDAQLTFAELLNRYGHQITPKKRSCVSEQSRLRTIKRHSIADLLTQNITASSIAYYREERLKSVSGPSVRKEIALILHALKIARHEWGVLVRDDVLTGITKPPASKPRTRRLESNELETILGALKNCRNPLVLKVFSFALATGMRRGEVLGLKWSNIDVTTRTAFLSITKNGDSRTVPLNRDALHILSEAMKFHYEPAKSVFPISANAVRLAWERVKKRTGISNLRFHDLRHEAISRFFEVGLTLPEVALISGHKDPRMLFRYTHLRAVDVAEKLKRIDET